MRRPFMNWQISDDGKKVCVFPINCIAATTHDTTLISKELIFTGFKTVSHDGMTFTKKQPIFQQLIAQIYVR